MSLAVLKFTQKKDVTYLVTSTKERICKRILDKG